MTIPTPRPGETYSQMCARVIPDSDHCEGCPFSQCGECTLFDGAVTHGKLPECRGNKYLKYARLCK